MKIFPKISIVTPSYNQGDFLEKTILSVLGQNYPNLEHIIIDGGSTDNSVDIIKKYEKHFTYWVSEKDRGQSHAINKGFQQASGELLGWLNSDDWLEPDALYTVAEYANTFPQCGAFVGAGQIVDQTGTVIYYKEPAELTFERFCQWFDGGNFTQPSCFFRSSTWEVVKPLDESLHIGFDLELWLRMAKVISFKNIDKLLSTSLSHKDAKTTAFKNHMMVEGCIIIIKAGGDKYVSNYLFEMANNYDYYKTNFEKIANHPLVKLISPLARIFIKPAVRWQERTPRWIGS